jgi:DNA-binding ferritin-like protein (Dps family)
MDYNEKVQGLATEIFETIERSVDKMTRIELDLNEFAESNEFTVTDVKDKDILAFIMPMLSDLVSGYLEAAREYDEE